MNRVVITGSSVISPVGTTSKIFWENIKNGHSGIKKITKFPSDELTCKVGAEVNDFDPNDYMDKKESKKMDLFMQYAVSTSLMAVKNANLSIEDEDKDMVGVAIGSGIGGITTFENQYKTFLEKGPNRVSPFFIPMLITNMATGQTAIAVGAKGVNLTLVSACASGADAIGNAFLTLKYGRANVMIAGGSEASLSFLPFSGFCAMKAMTSCTDENVACRPFDANRDGFIMGEGAGVLILETLNHALKRNANIIAEIVGFSSTNDAYHMTAPLPDGSGASKCMAGAIKDAEIKPENVGYINAHGTSTPYNDKIETLAIKNVFKDHAKNLSISSTKSMTGHLLGAAGAIETIITAYSLKEGYVAPTINYKDKDPECDLDYVPNKGKSKDIRYALSNSFGFGGHNCSIVLKKYEEN